MYLLYIKYIAIIVMELSIINSKYYLYKNASKRYMDH